MIKETKKLKLTVKKPIQQYEEIPVEVWLEQDEDGVHLMVDNHYVFSILSDGKGELTGGIDNDIGLQVNDVGKVILTED